MIELRCRFKKAVEIDPETVSIVYRCPTCSKTRGKPVFHRWDIADLLQFIKKGQQEGIIPPQ